MMKDKEDLKIDPNSNYVIQEIPDHLLLLQLLQVQRERLQIIQTIIGKTTIVKEATIILHEEADSTPVVEMHSTMIVLLI